MQWIIKYLTSSIGKKQIMGCTGAALAAFILGHMSGNMQLLNPNPEAAQASYNAYTQLLTGMGPMLVVIELALVVLAATHIFLAINLKIENKKARGGVDYDVNARKGKKSFASFTMIWTGILVAAFLVWHLCMLKYGQHYYYQNAEGEIIRDMWLTTIQMFSQPVFAIAYVVLMFVVGVHLYHAIASAFQTLGIAHQKWTPIIELFGMVFSIIVALGFAVEAAVSFYYANQPATQAIINKCSQEQYQKDLEQKAADQKNAKTSFVIPSVGQVQVSLNDEM
ncbi:MAG: succinate dehydrogenase cytochrome b subunit [Fibrobacteraceae bacterium]|nr:succinate dehydrogenase cytochrome b subunit [Fibrobacteraceae bacterium]